MGMVLHGEENLHKLIGPGAVTGLRYTGTIDSLVIYKLVEGLVVALLLATMPESLEQQTIF